MKNCCQTTPLMTSEPGYPREQCCLPVMSPYVRVAYYCVQSTVVRSLSQVGCSLLDSMETNVYEIIVVCKL